MSQQNSVRNEREKELETIQKQIGLVPTAYC